MITLDKYKNNYGYETVDINVDEEKFQITFAPNLDLYWIFHPKDSYEYLRDSYTFIITKENYYLYESFLELYEAISKDTPYFNNIFDVSYFKSNYSSKNLKLFVDDKIEWHSDDFYYEEASTLIIEKKEEEFHVIFKKGKNEYFLTYSIRFRNSGSRYSPFNASFMNMYNKLLKYDPMFHQIHIEEKIYELKK